MAPEQYEGREADAHTDIFAFGCVVYEMVTGKRCFEGKTKACIIAAVLGTDRPPMIRAGPVVPAALQRLVQRCLARDPEDRYQSMRDVVLELRSIGEGDPANPFPARALPYKPLFAIITVIAGVLTAALGFSVWVSRTAAPADSPSARLDIDLGTDVWLPIPKGWGSSIAISPDGTRLAFAAGNPVRLFTRRLDQRDAAELPGTQGASTAFFSPDGRWVGFYSGGKLNKVPVNGGAVVPLGDLGYFAGASWSAESGVLVSAVRQGVLKIPSSGGVPRLIAMPRDGEFALSVPQSLPGGRAILFGAVTLAADKSSVEVMTIPDHHRKVITSGQSPRYLSMPGGIGYLVYTGKSTLFAVRFDPDKLETQGTAVPVLEDVAYEPELGIGQFDFSPEPLGHGFLVYRSGRGSPMVRTGLQRIDSKGTRESLPTAPGNYDSPGVSPDGKRIALRLNKADIWVYDPERETMARVTFGGVVYDSPIWSPDGRYIVFGSYGKGLFQAPADGSGQPQALTHSESYQFPYSFTADGTRLAYVEGGTANREIWTLPLQDQGGQLVAGKPERFLGSGFNQRSPSFSPDGRWIAYDSNESGKFEVYVQPFPALSPGRGGKLLISNRGGVTPRFSRDGHDLLYASGNQIMAVAFTVKGDTFAAGKPRVWIDRLGVMPTGTPAWDLDPDGKRVVFLSPFESDEPPGQEHEVVLLLNFLDELRRKIPAGNQTR
jgi:serine/threonine-protein kinase